MADKEITRLHAVVEGTVQGVGFRNFVQENAYRLNLTGWVRNRWDGTVEVTAEGDRQDLEKLLQALRRGPRASTSRRDARRCGCARRSRPRCRRTSGR